MANRHVESNESGINVDEFFAAETANLSFASTAKMRGGSDEKTPADRIILDRRVDSISHLCWSASVLWL